MDAQISIFETLLRPDDIFESNRTPCTFEAEATPGPALLSSRQIGRWPEQFALFSMLSARIVLSLRGRERFELREGGPEAHRVGERRVELHSLHREVHLLRGLLQRRRAQARQRRAEEHLHHDSQNG